MTSRRASKGRVKSGWCFVMLVSRYTLPKRLLTVATDARDSVDIALHRAARPRSSRCSRLACGSSASTVWSSRIWTLVPKIACDTTSESTTWLREHVRDRAVDHCWVRFGNGDNGHGETQNDSDSHIFDIRRTRPAAGSPIYTFAGFTGNEGARFPPHESPSG